MTPDKWTAPHSRELPPMPTGVGVGATKRNDKPVAVLVFHDILGDTREMHLDPITVLDLQAQLALFSLQVFKP